MGELVTTEAITALLSLTALEIVLGIDNIVFISILTGRLPESARRKAWILGLALAGGMRIAMLFGISYLMKLQTPIFTMPIVDHETSVKDLILLVGGLFLMAKAVKEIHKKLEGPEELSVRKASTIASVLMQILIIDAVFSIDSVITAVGMTDLLWVMVTAIVISVIVMMIFAGPIGSFVHRHPTTKMLALAFLILIGVLLIADGIGQHINRGYVYFAMAFALVVEVLNLLASKRRAAQA